MRITRFSLPPLESLHNTNALRKEQRRVENWCAQIILVERMLSVAAIVWICIAVCVVLLIVVIAIRSRVAFSPQRQP